MENGRCGLAAVLCCGFLSGSLAGNILGGNPRKFKHDAAIFEDSL